MCVCLCLGVFVICTEMFVRIVADSQALVYISRCLETQSTDNNWGWAQDKQLSAYPDTSVAIDFVYYWRT